MSLNATGKLFLPGTWRTLEGDCFTIIQIDKTKPHTHAHTHRTADTMVCTLEQGTNWSSQTFDLYPTQYEILTGNNLCCWIYDSTSDNNMTLIISFLSASVMLISVKSELGRTHFCFVTTLSLVASWNSWLNLYSSVYSKTLYNYCNYSYDIFSQLTLLETVWFKALGYSDRNLLLHWNTCFDDYTIRPLCVADKFYSSTIAPNSW